MERMWSPWRSHYVGTADESNAQGCFLCACSQAHHATADNLVVAQYEHCVVVLNRFPYNAGHLLIAPNDHVAEFEALNEPVAVQMTQVTQQAIRVLNGIIRPHGYNFGANLGRSAGAGVPDHVHWHLVPRWNGDTNFMPTIGETKVMSHALEDLWEQFRHGFSQGHGG